MTLSALSSLIILVTVSLEIPANPGGPAYGYWAGGSGSQTVTRLDFGNDTAAQAPKGPLAQTAYSYGGTASSTNAYFYGGQMAGSRIQRINFATDTNTALLRGPLSAAAGGPARRAAALAAYDRDPRPRTVRPGRRHRPAARPREQADHRQERRRRGGRGQAYRRARTWAAGADDPAPRGAPPHHICAARRYPGVA